MIGKPELRAEARERLRGMDEAERVSASADIALRLWSLPEVASAGTLLLFASLRGEVDTDLIAREAARRGLTLVYPRCLPVSRSMDMHVVAGTEELAGGSYGIREPPPSCPRVHVEEVDVALVPGLAWDRDGTRMGRGAGYYDRLFRRREWRGFRCGLFFAVQEFPLLPRDAWDEPLDAVVTERELVRPAG